MLSTAETYRDAANEHLERASIFHEDARYFLSHYFSGLAVKCHLRAYLRKKTNVFDSRHDIEGLAQEGDFYDIVSRSQIDDFATIFALINQRWRSNHRYFSERQFLDYMNEIKAGFNQKGDRWKNLSRTMYNAASIVINQGEAKWNS